MHAKRGLVALCTVKECRSGMRIYGFAFLTKASLLFAGQNDLFYDRYRSYDSFVASVTHLFEVDLQSSSGLSFEFETTVSFLRPELSSFFACHQS